MVSNDFCFRTRFKSVVQAKQALDLFNAGMAEKDKWLEEDSEMPFFLDTCVLLNLYDISGLEREAFIQFLLKNKERMIIPSQVEREYIRHRIPRIKGFKGRVASIKNEVQGFSEKLAKTFDNLRGGVNGILNRNIVKYGMPNVSSKFNELLKYLDEAEATKVQHEYYVKFHEDVSGQIISECNKCCEEADYEYTDPILDAISQSVILQSLSEVEQTFIVELYKKLKKAYDEKEEKDKIDITFPGAGDDKKIVDNPIEESVAWGDLYIYHEIISYMKQHDTDAVLLTRDITKEDWLKQDKSQFVHYLVNAYEMTGHMLYIFDADDFLPMDFDSILDGPEPADEGDIPDGDTKVVANIRSSSELEEIPDSSSGISVDASLLQLKPLNAASFFSYYTPKTYKEITVDEFIAELRKSHKWSTSYSGGYVAEGYFIFNILGKKGYRYGASERILEQLIEEGKVEKYNENHDGHDVCCLKIKDES